MTETEKLWSKVVDPALRGAASGVLFDIPEFIAKQIDREATEKYIEENEPMYRGGQVAGTIGGAFIPVGGLAGKAVQALGKGAEAGSLLAKGAGWAKKLTDMGRTGTIGQRLLQGAVKGAGSGALEAGVRAAAGEKDSILEDIKTGALFGGAGGALGSAFKSGGEVLGEAKEAAQNAAIAGSGANARALKEYFTKFSGYKNPARQAGLLDSVRENLYNFQKRNNLSPTMGRDKILATVGDETAEKYKKLDELAEAYRPQLNEKLGIDQLKQDILEGFDLGDPQEVARISKALDGVIGAATTTKSLPVIRKKLRNVIRAGLGTDDPAKQAAADAAKILSSELDIAINDIAKASGVPDLADLAGDWMALNVYGKGALLDEIADMTRKSGGSPTFEKSAISQMLGGAGVGGLLGGSQQDWQDPEKMGQNIQNILLSSVAGAALPAAGQGLMKGAVGKTADIFKAMEENPKLLQGLEGLGDVLQSTNIGGKIPAVSQGVTDLNAAMDEIQNPTPKRLGPSPWDAQVFQGVGTQLLNAGVPPEQLRDILPRIVRDLSPEARIQIALPKEQQKEALEALQIHKSLDLIPALKEGSTLEKARAQGAIYQAISKASGGNTDLKNAANREAKKILSQGIGDSRKREMLSQLLASLDPAGYGNYREMGVLQ